MVLLNKGLFDLNKELLEGFKLDVFSFSPPTPKYFGFCFLFKLF